MNLLDVVDNSVARNRAVGAVGAFLYAVAGKPNPKKPKVVLWSGTVADVRTGARLNADDPSVCPTTDDEMVELLHYARPRLRNLGFLMSPQDIKPTSVIKVTSRPTGYRPEWDRTPVSR